MGTKVFIWGNPKKFRDIRIFKSFIIINIIVLHKVQDQSVRARNQNVLSCIVNALLEGCIVDLNVVVHVAVI